MPDLLTRKSHSRKGKPAEGAEERDIIQNFRKMRLEVERTVNIPMRKVELLGPDKFSMNLLDHELDTHNDIKREDFRHILKQYTQLESGNPTDRYLQGDKLGSGGQGDVYLGTEWDTGKFVALKIREIPELLDPVECKELCSEVVYLQKVDHKNIVKFHGCYVCNDSLWIIMDIVDGISVHKLIKQEVLTENKIATIVKGILEALQYIHTQGLIHCDIKPANLMLRKDGVTQVIDLGLCTKQAVGLTERRGTTLYMAPEMAHRVPYDQKVDIWALGISILNMSLNYVPYKDKPAKEIRQLIRQNGKPHFDREGLSVLLLDFLDHCLEPDPAERPSAAELLLHPFLRPDLQEKTRKEKTMPKSPRLRRSVLAYKDENLEEEAAITQKYTVTKSPRKYHLSKRPKPTLRKDRMLMRDVEEMEKKAVLDLPTREDKSVKGRAMHRLGRRVLADKNENIKGDTAVTQKFKMMKTDAQKSSRPEKTGGEIKLNPIFCPTRPELQQKHGNEAPTKRTKLRGTNQFSMNLLDHELATHYDIKREDFLQILRKN